MTKVFFSENGGLTLTSCENLHSIAKQEKVKYKTFLENVNFVNEQVALIGSDANAQYTHRGYNQEQLNQIAAAIAKVGKLNSFIAWLSEARKARDEKIANERLTYKKWLEVNGYEVPVHKTEQDIINEFDVEARREWEELIATQAVIGEYIIDGDLEKAKKKAHDALNNTCSTTGSGRDTVIYTKSLSVDVKEIDSLYASLQRKWRELEKRKNSIRYQIKNELLTINNEVDRISTELANKYAQFIREKDAELSKIKFVIPNEYKSLMDELNSL